MHDRSRALDRLDHLPQLEGLLQEPIEARALEPLQLPVGQFAAHRDDPRHLQVIVGPDKVRDLAGIALAQVRIQRD